MLGWLSNPFVTMLFLAEQASILIHGSTPRATDLRIALSFTVEGLVAIALVLALGLPEAGSELGAYAAVLCLAALLTSKNYLFGIGLGKGADVKSDSMRKIERKVEIAFA